MTLSDRRELKAKLVGADPKTDLAVLKLPGSGFSIVPVGDSSRVEVAEVVLAIGNPFGLAQTVTMGIVSAVGRANVGIADYEDFIQTDAAINPGNSGGALVSAGGALIGINTAIFTQSGGYMGIGFAVPINMARQVMDQLVTRGRLNRGYLGVAVQERDPGPRPRARAVRRGRHPRVRRHAGRAGGAGWPAARRRDHRRRRPAGDRRRPLPQSRGRDGRRARACS